MDLKSEKAQGGADRFLCFTLGGEEYAIPLLAVKEVIAPPEITPVPQCPPYFLGIMNLRGQIISVIDMRTKLGIKPSAGSENAIIICDVQPNPMGIMVDAINSVHAPSADEMSGKPELRAQKSADHIAAVFRSRESLVLILDIERALDLPKVVTAAAAATASSPKAA